MNILVTLDQGYLEQLKVMLYSLIREHEKTELSVYLVHSSLTEEQIQAVRELFLLPGHELKDIRIQNDFLQGMPVTSRYPVEMYYRIFAAQYLPEELDRILYLDPDIVIINSLEELYSTPTEGCLFAAASHAGQALHRINAIRLGTVPSPRRVHRVISRHRSGLRRMSRRLPYAVADSRMLYINSGVMLLNLTALRREQEPQRVLRYLKEHETRMWYPDQDVISAVYRGRILELDTLRYNLNERTFRFFQARPQYLAKRMDLDWVKENTCIIHYCGRNKPWKPDYFGEFGQFYDRAQEGLEQDFPHAVKKAGK